ncbi:hypothetical protein HPB52_011709 [Rhipicephalus sanguineus]|uniref:Uncharacterized protein n=1 Tax=Rhipicephalus sanguineus TaxID=34632 RepID=A0A9D4Q6C2_RHISA|nr:hypothetical protein HPB52_011709 [Rhipicephalus sanguineus]
MAPRPLFSSSVVFCTLLRLVVCQLEAMNARDHFNMVHDKHDHADVSSSSTSSGPDLTPAALATTSIGTTASNGTPGSTALALGFGSDCSHEGQCSALLGLACVSNGNSAAKCTCALSTPIYVNEGGVHKCVRAKNLNEACVSNQECSYGNPNVQCVNSLCNCSHPFELTAARLCLLPTNQGGDMVTIALSVMLALALLLLAAGYVYQNSDVTTTSSTIYILTKDRSLPDVDNEPEYSAGDNDCSEAQEEESRRQRRVPHGGSYMRDPSMPPRHPPRFIRQQAAKGHKTPRLSTVQEADSSSTEGDEQLELHSSGSSVADKPEEDPRATPHCRTRKGGHLPRLDGRKTDAELVYDEPGSSSSPMHMLGPKDEQMQRVFDKQQVVDPRLRGIYGMYCDHRRSLGTASSPPPVVSLRRLELSPLDSTDDSFMKDLKRRRSLKARFSDDLCGTVSTRCSVSAEPLRVAAAAVQCDSAQVTPAEAAPQKVATVANEAQRDAEPPTTDVGGIGSVRRKKSSMSSAPTETTPSLSAQKPYQEYITKQLQPPVHFAERPFAEVLASMESEMTTFKEDDHTVCDQGPGRVMEKSPSSSTPQTSNQSAMNDEKFDKAAIESSSKGASGTGSGATATSGDVAESSSSVVSTAVTPDGKIAFKAAKTTTSIDSDNSSKEILRVRLTMSDSDDGSFPPSGSMSLSFVSSNSSCSAAHRLTDLADLPRLERSVAATSHETGDGSLLLHMPLPQLTSLSAVQTESSRPPASSLTECGTQVQLLPEPEEAARSGRHQLWKTRRREVDLRAATDRPWTEDVKRVVMLGNKHYLRQHAGRRPMANSATTFDETQYVLFKIDDQAQPGTTASPVAPKVSLSTSMTGELAGESSESTLELLLQRSTVSSGRDVDTLASDDNNYEQPLKLSDLIFLQHPEVGLKNFTAVDFSKIAAPEGVAECRCVEARLEDKQAPDLNSSQEFGTVERVSDKAAGISREQLPSSNDMVVLKDDGGKCPDALRKPQRPSLKPCAKATDQEHLLEKGGAISKWSTADAPAARETEPTVRFATPLPSQHVVFLPDRSVAIRLPGGVIRSVHPGPQTFGTASSEGTTTITVHQRTRQLRLATSLDEPTFESIYNAILQPPPRVATASDSNAPGDVPSPGGVTSSTRAVSFDESFTTVVPLEPPSEAFKYDTADATTSSESEAPSKRRKARRRSSLCRSLSGSGLHAPPAATGVEGTKVACGAAHKMRLGGSRGLAPAQVRPGAAVTKAADAEGEVPERRGHGSEWQETPTPLLSPFYSFDDTYSELSFLSDSNNFISSRSVAGSQRSDEHKEADGACAPWPA